ncbi:MAG: SPFH domain-containing protein, partial [Myxococcota bacterium]
MLKLFQMLTFGLIQVCLVRQGEVRVLERRGQFTRVANPGLHVLIAMWGAGEQVGRFDISKVIKGPTGRSMVQPRNNVDVISTRMQVDDYPSESVITKDNATVSIDAVVYYRVVDPKKAVYNVQDYVAALQKLVQSALRDQCGQYELDELLTSRDSINSRLQLILDEATDPWGIKVDRVELKDIELGEFGRILAEQRAAETKRRTEITVAEGRKRSAVLQAEGENEAAVLRAEAAKQSRILDAEARQQAELLAAEAKAQSILRIRQAEAEGFRMLRQQLENNPAADDILRLMQIQKAGEVGAALAQGQATKFFLPADISNMFGIA